MTLPTDNGGHEPSLWQIIATVAALPGTALMVGWIAKTWGWFWGRRDSKSSEASKTELSTLEQMRVELQASGTRMDARVERQFQQFERTIEHKDEEIRALAYDRERGWNLCRHWYWRLRELVPETRHARAIAESAARRLIAAGLMNEADMPTFDYPLPAIIPELEDPFPREPRTDGPHV